MVDAHVTVEVVGKELHQPGRVCCAAWAPGALLAFAALAVPHGLGLVQAGLVPHLR